MSVSRSTVAASMPPIRDTVPGKQSSTSASESPTASKIWAPM